MLNKIFARMFSNDAYKTMKIRIFTMLPFVFASALIFAAFYFSNEWSESTFLLGLFLVLAGYIVAKIGEQMDKYIKKVFNIAVCNVDICNKSFYFIKNKPLVKCPHCGVPNTITSSIDSESLKII